MRIRGLAAAALSVALMMGCGSESSEEDPPSGGSGEPASAATGSATGSGAQDPATGEATATEEGPPTQGGEHEPFAVVPQDVIRYLEELSYALSPNGSLAALIDGRGGLSIIDTRSGVVRAHQRVSRSAGYDDPTPRVEFVANSRLFTHDGYGGVCLWDLRADSLRCSRLANIDIEDVIAVSHGGTHFAYTSCRRDGESRTRHCEVRVQAVTSSRSRALAELPELDENRSVLVYGHRNRRLAVGGDERAWLLDPRRGAVVSELEGSTLRLDPFGPQGHTLVTFGEEAVELRDATTGELQHSLGIDTLPSRSRRLHWSEDGHSFAACVDDEQALHVDVSGARILGTVDVAECFTHRVLAVDSRGVRVEPRASLEYDGEDNSILVSYPGRERTHEVRVGFGEHSLWHLFLHDDRAETHRRGSAEVWGTEGMQRLRRSGVDAEEGDDDTDYRVDFEGLVAASPPGGAELWVDREGQARIRRAGHEDVALSDGFPLICAVEVSTYSDTQSGGVVECSSRIAWAPDGSTVVLSEGGRVGIYDVESGRRRGLIRAGAPCHDPACGEDSVCREGICQERFPFSSGPRIIFGSQNDRFVVLGPRSRAALYDLDGQRLARLATGSEQNAAGLHQSVAFAPDGETLAFSRRRRLQLLSAEDGSEVRVFTLPHPLQWMRYSEDGASLLALTTHDELIRMATVDGTVTGTRDLSGLRRVNEAKTLAVVCREGLVHLVRLDEESERGPLGRCPPWGRFVFGESERTLGWVGGAVARVHRVSDGEVLTLRSVRLRSPLPPIQVAFSDTGFFEAVHARPTHLRVREGGISGGRIQGIRGNAHERPGLVAAFFGGEPLRPAPGDEGAE